jgi:hypothetical protein
VLKPEILEKYAGKYKFNKANLTLTLTRVGEKLVAEMPMQASIVIFPVSQTEFVMKGEPIKVNFEWDESGQVSGLVLNQNGKDSTATKIE